MDMPIITSLIAFIGAMLSSLITYFLTKKKDRESEWRKEKLSYYKAFIESLSRIIEDESTPEGQQQFAQAGNNLLLFAPHDVLKALSAFREEIRTSNKTRTREAHDRLLTQLLLRIRADIGVFPVDDSATFTARLWASGTRAI